jgi:hypothetical protein
MPTHLRNNTEGSERAAVFISTDSYDLNSQLDELMLWLSTNTDFVFGTEQWVVDIGFSRPKNGSMASYTVPVELMGKLSDKNITLWLSEY